MIELLTDLNIEGKAEPIGALLTLSKESEALLIRKGQAKNVNKNINKGNDTGSGEQPDSSGNMGGVKNRRNSGGRSGNSSKVKRSGKTG